MGYVMRYSMVVVSLRCVRGLLILVTVMMAMMVIVVTVVEARFPTVTRGGDDGFIGVQRNLEKENDYKWISF